jgi:hypothetical protein
MPYPAFNNAVVYAVYIKFEKRSSARSIKKQPGKGCYKKTLFKKGGLFPYFFLNRHIPCPAPLRAHVPASPGNVAPYPPAKSGGSLGFEEFQPFKKVAFPARWWKIPCPNFPNGIRWRF